MTDWHSLVKEEYNKVANSLLADGFKKQKRSDIYKEQFTKNGQTLVIIRALGSPNWWTKKL